MCLILKVSSSVSSEMVLKKSVKSWGSLSLCVKRDASVVKWVFRSYDYTVFLVFYPVFQTLADCLSERALRRKLVSISFITF